MTLDGLVVRSLVRELKSALVGGRISKINQPSNHDLVFTIYNNRTNYKLYLSASSNAPRMLLTDRAFTNPLTPPSFNMFLRKHLQGGTIVNIEQTGLDRIASIDMNCFDELGVPVVKSLVIELMGKYSNIVLVDKSSQKILESIRRISFDMSNVRQVYPGLIYPQVEDTKIDVTFDDRTIIDVIATLPGALATFKVFYTTFTGFSPIIGREICYRAGIDAKRPLNSLASEELESLDEAFITLRSAIRTHQYDYSLVEEGNTYKEFHCLNLRQFGDGIKKSSSMSEAIDLFYTVNDKDDRLSQMIRSLQKTLGTKIQRLVAKRAKLVDEQRESADRDIFRVYGDLLSAAGHRIQKGDTIISVENFFDENLEIIEIPLNPTKSPWENAQYYYKKYSKLKKANQLLAVALPKLDEEVEYLEQTLDSLDNLTTVNEYKEVRDELIHQRVLKRAPDRKKTEKPSKPLHFTTDAGSHIYVGKNNLQNDYLTLKFAGKNDLFFHARNIPGSHVILRQEATDDDQAMAIAAFLAATHSKHRHEPYVDVDYTERKNVRKQKGAKPGMVYYDHFTTIRVDTTDQLMREIVSKA